MELRSAEAFSIAVREGSRIARSVSDFLAWMDGVSEERRKLHQDDRQEAYRLQEFRDPWKYFLEELFPLSLWLRSKPDLGLDTIVQPTMSSEPPDATLTFIDGSTLNVEVVKSRDGWLEEFQFKVMKRFGWVPLTAKGGVQGLKTALAEDKEPEFEAADSRKAFAALVQDVQNGIDDKASRSHYFELQPIVLLAVANDTFASGLEDFSAAIAVPERHPFQEIYLVSTLKPRSIRIFPAEKVRPGVDQG